SVSCVPASPTKPEVFPLSLRSAEPDGQVVIACLVQGFFPSEPLTMTWNKSGEVRHFLPSQAGTGGLYTASSQLTLPAAQCPDGSSVQCHVKHHTYPNQDVLVPCTLQPPVVPSCCHPKLSLSRPAVEDLLLGLDANLTCTLSGLVNPNNVIFAWTTTAGKDAVQQTAVRDSCGCYSVSSVLPGCAEPWNRGDHFTCTATQSDSKIPLTWLSTPAGNTFRPQVHLLPPPSEELALNELVTLTCLVRGFSPSDVMVRWLHGSQELPRGDYLTWAPRQEPGQGAKTFAVTSTLRVTAEDWKRGDIYSCMVGHETLPLSFTQKTIDRLAGKPTHVNVSVIMSEADGVCY
uniref:Ig-like domain-containing protein n=1 Tax=Otolemur garnettii TaxID=30611 RepID=H0XU96_OTOGA